MIFSALFSRKWLLISLLVIVMVCACIRLGIWQLDRLAQRRVFNSHVLAVQAMPVLSLPASADLTTMEYRQAEATGMYDFVNQVAIRNQFYGNQFGYHLITPLRLADGEAVLVDRGWIPADGNSKPVDWRKYDQSGSVMVRGEIRLSQEPSSFAGVIDPTLTPGQTGLDFWVYVNLARIRQQIPYDILPAYVQINPDPSKIVPPIPIQPELDLTEGPHQGYAIQWFSFATVILVGYPLYVHRQEIRK